MRRSLGIAAIVLVACALAWPMQVNGDNQNAHYALTKAIARGVPYIDDTLVETGDLQSHDTAQRGEHLYTVKSPGLAMAAAPTYLVVEGVGARTTGDPTRVVWFLNLFTSVLATVALLFALRAVAERFEPGFGSATAVIVGLGALTLPFATLFFSHALSAGLVFVSFALLVRRDVAPWRLVAAGIALGASVVVELGAWPAALVVAIYALAVTRSVRRFVVFAAGGALGVLPLAVFNAWAFGNPLHTAYSDYLRTHNEWDHTAFPNWEGLSPQLFSSLGLLTLAPILGAGVAGAVVLYRRGMRAEALVCAGVPIAMIAYYAGNGAFGGLGPPRTLTPIMPFALAPVAVALRRWPLATLTAAAVTCFQAVLMTATGPLAAYDGDWLTRVANRQFVATAASLVGITGWYAIAPFLLAVAAALGLALGSLEWSGRFAASDALAAVIGLVTWGVVALASYNDYGHTPSVRYVVTIVAALSIVALVAAATASRASRRAAPQLASP